MVAPVVGLPTATIYSQGRGSGSAHIDPSKFSFEELSHIRGSMWTARWDNRRYGPSSGILAMDFYEYYPADERRQMRKAYKDRGYTHYVTGPMVDLGGYHGLYPTTDIRGNQPLWDLYLDSVQECWDDGLIPIHFVHPDGWNIEDMRQILDFYRQPRAQKLLRVVVWTGWEPVRYEWENATWNTFLQQAMEVMPLALKCVHTVADYDALTGGNDYRTLGSNGNAVCWQRSAPMLHTWLTQFAGYYTPIQQHDHPGFAAQYAAFQTNLKGAMVDLRKRFHTGYAEWPTTSLWGGPLKVVAGEYAAYPNFWDNFPEAESIVLGNLALDGGADGYLDGGSHVV